MRILGIETSCDETAAAVVEDGTKILSSVVASSQELHVKTGGIIPEKAAREQIKAIVPVINEALTPLRQGYEELSAIAVTVGPGLIGSLLVGVETAKTLAYIWKKPIIPVNHLVGHIYANWLGRDKPEFPALSLVVSGGHTDLVYIKGHGRIKRVGGTRDDAAGEAFDKTARILGLAYPGGPSISKASKDFLHANPNVELKLFPRPMINEDNFEWSFSGLKTAVLRETKNQEHTRKNVERLATEVQEAINDCLVIKSMKAVEKYHPKSFLLSGGVAANTRLRAKFENEFKKRDVKFFVPDPRLCTDNAAFIAAAAYFNHKEASWKKLKADPQLQL